MLDDSGHVKVVFENVKGLIYFHFLGAGIDVVDQDVVGVPQVMTGMKNETAGNRAEGLGIDSIDDVEAILRN